MSNSAEHPYASFIHGIEKPVRYLGGEHGAVVKPWTPDIARIALAFPDLYDIGMSHLGFKILYGIFNGHPRLAAEPVAGCRAVRASDARTLNRMRRNVPRST